jgi:hypothetical protein
MNEDGILKKLENKRKTGRGRQDGKLRLGNIPFGREKTEEDH